MSGQVGHLMCLGAGRIMHTNCAHTHKSRAPLCTHTCVHVCVMLSCWWWDTGIKQVGTVRKGSWSEMNFPTCATDGRETQTGCSDPVGWRLVVRAKVGDGGWALPLSDGG
uniref:Uncharacterized protein n=1 Tax=Trypanosoma vivax (strain Y486) TaxID=1055687 RepID=G0TVV0_TRYVY|nr:hypothetical protein TVY486_0502680 [Trypanosoma vivax Y486]